MTETLINAKTYFAIQIQRQERASEIAELVLSTAEKVGSRFKRLESLDTITIGSTCLLRFRSDVDDATPFLDVLVGQKRGVVRMQEWKYFLVCNGRKGTIPTTTMLSTPCRTDQQCVYLGTAIPHWQQQFKPA